MKTRVLVATLVLLVSPATLIAGTNEGSYEVLENGAGKFKVEIQGCPVASANVEAITIEDLVIDEREVTTGADWDYRVYGPGDAHYGSITIRSRVGASGTDLRDWFMADRQTGCGRELRKAITINLLRHDETVARTYNFFDCLPVSFSMEDDPATGAPIEVLVARPEGFECVGSDPDPGVGEVVNGFQVALQSGEGEPLLIDSAWEFAQGGARCQERTPLPFGDPTDPAFRRSSRARSLTGIQLRGPLTSGRKALCEWITETVQGKNWKRTVTVLDLSRPSRQRPPATFTYRDAFPVRYVFPSLSASGTGNLYEEVGIKPIRLDLS